MGIKGLLLVCILICVQCAANAALLDVGSTRLAIGAGIKLFYESREVWSQPQPAALEIVSKHGDSCWLTASYGSATPSAKAIICRASITSPKGTEFVFTDVYRAKGTSCEVERSVDVRHPSSQDAAFSTRFSVAAASEADLTDYDILAPGVWYGRNEHVGRYAIGGNYSDDFFLIREDRLAAPFVMARGRQTGLSLCIADGAPDASTFAGEDFLARIVDERLRFASIGISRRGGKGIDLVFQFPGSEGEKTYIEGGSSRKRWAYRSHPLKAGVKHSYTVVLRVDRQPSFPSAVRDTWRWAYKLYDPRVTGRDLPQIYSTGVDLLSRYVKVVNDAPGVPFSISIDGSAGDYNYLMGFVGGQVLAGYHLLRSDDHRQRSMGEAIVDFWVTHSYDGRAAADALPHTWYQPGNPGGSGPHWGQAKTERFWRDEPNSGQVFLRTLCEGHSAALDAWKLAEKRGTPHPEWLSWCRRFGDWLAHHQNPDGSFCRKYGTDGAPIDRSANNTCSAIDYLIRLHQATGDESYLNSALRAGRYAWANIHIPAVYAGGTNDNPNVLDKEAVLIDLRAFISVYEATRDAKWLVAARQAADLGETWTYIWNIPIPDGSTGAARLDGISTVGLSLVAAGHSYTDLFNASAAFDYWRLWKITGDTHYRDFSMLLFYGTKQMLDTDGSKGYGHRGLQVEGLGLSVVRGSGPRVWLPWVTLAHIDPIAQLEDAGDERELADLVR